MIDPGVERQINNSRKGKKGTTIKSFLILYFFLFCENTLGSDSFKSWAIVFHDEKVNLRTREIQIKINGIFSRLECQWKALQWKVMQKKNMLSAFWKEIKEQTDEWNNEILFIKSLKLHYNQNGKINLQWNDETAWWKLPHYFICFRSSFFCSK